MEGTRLDAAALHHRVEVTAPSTARAPADRRAALGGLERAQSMRSAAEEEVGDELDAVRDVKVGVAVPARLYPSRAVTPSHSWRHNQLRRRRAVTRGGNVTACECRKPFSGNGRDGFKAPELCAVSATP